MAIARNRRVGVLVVVAIAAVVAADQLLYLAWPGWTRGVALLLAAALAALRDPRALRTLAGAAGAAAVVVAAAGQAVDGGWLAGAVGVVGALSIALAARGAAAPDIVGWLERLAAAAVGALPRAVVDAQVAERWRRRHPRRIRLGRVLAWGWPVAIGGLFLGLFGLANPVVEDLFASLGRRLEALVDPELLPAPARIVLWLAYGVAAWGLLRLRAARRARRRAIPRAIGRDAVATDAGFVIRALIVCNAVFAFETALDALYLVGGAALPAGMSYAGYAHRGAYPLLATALLAAGFVLAWFRRGAAAGASPAARRLVYAWLAQDVVLVGSAAWRLQLYVDAYGLTGWRLATAAWMALVAVGLIAMALRIALARDNRWLVGVNALATMALFAGWGFVNADGVIAVHNVRHCRETGGDAVAIDVDYLRSLGPQAAPALAWLATRSRDPGVARAAGAAAAELRAALAEQLADRRGWTLARSRAAAAAR